MLVKEAPGDILPRRSIRTFDQWPHITSNILVKTCSNSGFSPVHHQAITWTSVYLKSTGPSGTNIKLSIITPNYSFAKMYFKIENIANKMRPFCFQLTKLLINTNLIMPTPVQMKSVTALSPGHQSKSSGQYHGCIIHILSGSLLQASWCQGQPPATLLAHLPLDKMAAILADDIFNHIFLNENDWIPTRISLRFVARSPIDNKPALVQVMAWHRTGNKPLPE